VTANQDSICAAGDTSRLAHMVVLQGQRRAMPMTGTEEFTFCVKQQLSCPSTAKDHMNRGQWLFSTSLPQLSSSSSSGSQHSPRCRQRPQLPLLQPSPWAGHHLLCKRNWRWTVSVSVLTGVFCGGAGIKLGSSLPPAGICFNKGRVKLNESRVGLSQAAPVSLAVLSNASSMV
jgi:hypothetical protein